ncbi:MAG: single-stranded-DNA-specific exonuclease RecJ [Candidatus Neomarinimicrobiota bacterium]
MNWHILEPDLDLVNRLKSEFRSSEIIARVMANRGIESRAGSESFFAPGLEMFHDPLAMCDTEKAARLVLEHIASGNPIMVFGDYDVDGTTAAAMLYLVLKSLDANVTTYIPNRELEGYGLSKFGIDYAKAISARLLITCDCGINAFDQVDYARQLGLDVIITDHHTPDEGLPRANAILNPKRTDCFYPFPGLCGGGVAYKLALAITQLSGRSIETMYQYLDLITLGTAADMVPILDENRVIVYHGLQQLRNSTRPGLQALLKKVNLTNGALTVGQIVFWLAPRINAAGRLGDANRSVELLTTNDPARAALLATELDEENQRRQTIQQEVVDEALRMVNSQVDLTREKAIVLSGNDWHPGVVGIVASRVKEEFNRPAIIISMDRNGVGKGSARSIKDFDLYEALTANRHLLDGYGGHPMAAGLTVREENLAEFRKTFVAYANSHLSEEQLIASITLDGIMELGDINSRLMTFLDKLGPYGPGNMRPKFAARNLAVTGHPRIIGGAGDHIRFRVRQERVAFDAIGFNLARHYEKLITGLPVDLAFVVETNEWQGQKFIQLNVRDIKRSGVDG